MKKGLFFLGIAALTLASCSQEDVIDVNRTAVNGNSIAFRARTGKATRALDMTTAALEKFNVYAYKGDCNELGESDNLEDYFGEWVEFSTDGSGLFTSARPYYYPTDNVPLTFVAYAPIMNNINPTTTTKGELITEFTVADKIEDQIDFVCATALITKADADELGAPELVFEHTLAKVFVSEVWSDDDRYSYEVYGVRFGNVKKSGTINYNVFVTEETEEDLTYHCRVTPKGDDSEFTYIFDEPITVKPTGKTNLMSGNPFKVDDDTYIADYSTNDATGAFMMIPQQLSFTYADESDGDQYASVKALKFVPENSYIALLIRVVYNKTGEVVYPYENGVNDITVSYPNGDENAKKYAWAAFPVSSHWECNRYVDYGVDFSKGVGFVAPGAEGYDGDYKVEVGQPILGNKIMFTESVLPWSHSGDITTVEQEFEGTVNVGDFEDPFGDDSGDDND